MCQGGWRIEVLGKFTQKNRGVGRSGGGRVGVGVRVGVRVDVNAMLGVGVMWGMGDVNQE